MLMILLGLEMVQLGQNMVGTDASFVGYDVATQRVVLGYITFSNSVPH